jgi:cytochrome c-type biogenesis protein CcmF
MNYTGEHLFPGTLGHFAAVLSLVVSLVASTSFFKSNKSLLPAEKQGWLRLARAAFFIETVCVITTIACIYYILSQHLFEYHYAWEHSDKTLQVQYIFSCLWEGQEGSFLLWTFWHCVLGWVLIATAKKWEAPVMTVISFAQFCLATMIIGIYFFGVKVGSNPFILLRDEGTLYRAPIFIDAVSGNIRADYLTLLKDGSGLNALLQNYWMVIHPPILFLGFASTIVPFAFAFAGLINKDHEWTRKVLPWAAFSGAVLGTGITMGAAWAYESLTFGGYWAWDPVENASLVPWLIMIAGLHMNAIYNSTKYSLKSTYLFYILSFILILYSTFLTRSGILGDSSVHAFTGADMTTQLVIFILIFFIPAIFLFVKENKHIPSIKKEESSYSREFWMFIGSLVIFLSAIIIIAQTSLPVIDKIFGKKYSDPADREFSYNQIQVYISIIIGLLTAVTQYLKFKDTAPAYFRKKIWLPTLVALIISISISIWGNINFDKKGYGFLAAIHVAIFAAVYSVIANGSYIWIGMKGKMKAAGASVAHVGFGLVLVAILISSSKKEVLSWNTTGFSTLKNDSKENPAENITLFKGVATDMGKYMVTYARDTFNNDNHKKYFELKFVSKENKDTFNLYPDVIKNNKGNEGFSPNPDSRHFWNKDIFAYVTSWLENDKNDTTTFREEDMKVGDTLFYSNGIIILNKVDVNKPVMNRNISQGETSLMLDMTVITKDGRHYEANPGMAIQNDSTMRNLPDSVIAQSLILRFNKVIDTKTGTLSIGVKESNVLTDLLTLKVYQFPFITLLWIGVMVMVIGFVMTIFYRNKINRLSVK